MSILQMINRQKRANSVDELLRFLSENDDSFESDELEKNEKNENEKKKKKNEAMKDS